MTDHQHQYVFWMNPSGPGADEPMTCFDCGATRPPDGTIPLEELHPVARDLVLALIAAETAADARRERIRGA